MIKIIIKTHNYFSLYIHLKSNFTLSSINQRNIKKKKFKI